MFVISYKTATDNGSIVCQCIWSRTIVIGYNIVINAYGRVNVGVSCMTEPPEIFDILVLSDYQVHFTLKCYILLRK